MLFTTLNQFEKESFMIQVLAKKQNNIITNKATGTEGGR